MSSLAIREFTEFALDGNNYLTWKLDVEMHLASKSLSETIVAPSRSTDAQKAQALIFLRHHLNHNLKNEYLTEKDPLVLWTSLMDRFDQQSSIILPQAQFDWLNLRFLDFKSVTDYNSALHKIVSQLKLCKQTIEERDLIEKTLSTFHASSLVLQQQYRAKNYVKHSELIFALLFAEKHNQLLMKNHNARPIGSAPVPEAHNVAQTSNFRGAEEGVLVGVMVVAEVQVSTMSLKPKIVRRMIKLVEDDRAHRGITLTRNKFVIDVDVKGTGPAHAPLLHT
ncbi:uncharacterized protein LOC116001237 [Ipomoea triloba]|uniref:uncharacterized protein LOC116001237 n=1 Tax=Ipomoea triloba TaxID=35885 RepID=UPI00125E27B1|nr:uncharacterized protein LOC116001237 [Ipomoea triloba]